MESFQEKNTKDVLQISRHKDKSDFQNELSRVLCDRSQKNEIMEEPNVYISWKATVFFKMSGTILFKSD